MRSKSVFTTALVAILLIALNSSAAGQQQTPSAGGWLLGTWAGTQGSMKDQTVLLSIVEKDGRLHWERTLGGMSNGSPLRGDAKAAGFVAERPGGIVELTGQYVPGGWYRGNVYYSLSRNGDVRLTGNVVGGSGIANPVELQKKD
jgi:hypothetical protein